MANKILSLTNINLTLEKNNILKDINLELEAGDIVSLLGPSGCGKTSLLRVIAGLEERSIGEIMLKTKIIQSKNQFTQPQARNIGMVFQDYALFPHLTVSENILFGLGHLRKIDRSKKLQEMLNLTKINIWKDSYPHKLSGGQQQRVALARALAQEPALLLLDEPFSSLDTELRYKLSEEIRNILKELNITAILVTHDQTEAFSFSDKIGVMKNGKIEQFSRSYDLYHTPKTPFVANFIGEGVVAPLNLIKDYRPDLEHLKSGSLLIRPEDIIYEEKSTLKARISKKNFRGSHFLYVLDFDNGLRVLSLMQSHHDHQVGDFLSVRIDIEHIVHFLDSSSVEYFKPGSMKK